MYIVCMMIFFVGYKYEYDTICYMLYTIHILVIIEATRYLPIESPPLPTSSTLRIVCGWYIIGSRSTLTGGRPMYIYGI